MLISEVGSLKNFKGNNKSSIANVKSNGLVVEININVVVIINKILHVIYDELINAYSLILRLPIQINGPCGLTVFMVKQDKRNIKIKINTTVFHCLKIILNGSFDNINIIKIRPVR